MKLSKFKEQIIENRSDIKAFKVFSSDPRKIFENTDIEKAHRKSNFFNDGKGLKAVHYWRRNNPTRCR